MPDDSAKTLSSVRYERIAHGFMIVAALAVFGCFAVYFYHFHGRPIGETAAWGEFGSYLSGVAGTILAGFTLAALALTLSLQARQLNEAKKVAQEQYKIFAQQSATLSKQAFESTYFQLIQRFTAISNELRQRKLFDQFENAMMAAWASTMPGPDPIAWLEGRYRILYEQWEPDLGPYYRLLFHVIRFVDVAALTDQEKRGYITLARAQLGADELIMLFMNVALGSEGRSGMKPLVEKYGLLKHARDIRFPQYLQSLKDSMIKPSAYHSHAEREAARRTNSR